VRERYENGARERLESLCCAVSYDPRYLEIIPREVVERDYGCADPTPYIKPGDTVLDLGSGSGKVSFIAAQIVGASGRVIGVDVNSEMLELARRHAPAVGAKLGVANVEFRRARLEDLAIDLDGMDAWLAKNPVFGVEDLWRLDDYIARARSGAPLIANESVDIVISNCVLNLVRDSDKRKVFNEVYRALRRGGRAVISDIVADEPVPAHLKNDPELWSGCVSGALQEGEFLRAFEEAGFHAIEILKRDTAPWRTIEGIDFRSITVRAMKGKEGPCLDCNQAVIYRGPWRKVEDDDGHTLLRGQPMAVCEKTFKIYTGAPYAPDIIPVPPVRPVALEAAPAFDCSRDTMRHPRETKGLDYRITADGAASCCGPEGCR
jgi:ubiquinone/menaquinone biosynthesis C-methylase UbiE